MADALDISASVKLSAMGKQADVAGNPGFGCVADADAALRKGVEGEKVINLVPAVSEKVKVISGCVTTLHLAGVTLPTRPANRQLRCVFASCWTCDRWGDEQGGFSADSQLAQ